MKQPPLHARKSFVFKLNEQDYFGAFNKQKQVLAMPSNASADLLQSATNTKSK